MSVYTFENAIQSWLDRPIAYHRVFVELTGSVQAAIMLSQAVYWSKRTKDVDGWFYKTADDWEDETGLTRREQDTARKHLRNTGFWGEKLKGVPATTHYKIDSELLYSSLNKTAKVDYTKGAIQNEQKRQSSMNKSAKHSITETTTDTTFTESKDSVSKKPLNSDPEKLSIEVPKKEAAPKNPVFTECVDLWLKVYRPGWTFGAMHGKALKSIISKIKTSCKNGGLEGTDGQQIASFKRLMTELPEWYKTKDLPVIDSKFNEIITEIQQHGKPKQFNSKNSADRFSDFAQ